MHIERLELLKEVEEYIPPIHPLSLQEQEKFYFEVFKKNNITKEQFLSGDLFNKILYNKDREPMIKILNKNSNDEFEQFLRSNNISEQVVNLNYNYSINDIDQVAMLELLNNFIYYWYPSVDDLLIFSQSMSWIIGVRHDGCIFFEKNI